MDKDVIYPFYDKVLTSTGFDVTDLFSNLDIIEKISSRNDITLFDDELQKTKNAIFKNIYNNLSYILKAKGTEKSIKSLLRSYGLNDELVKINLYADNYEYNIGDRSSERSVKKKTLTLAGSSSVYLSSSAINELDYEYYTFEASVAFPAALKPISNSTYSLMGLQNNTSLSDLTWATNTNQYYITIENNLLSGSKFILSDNYSNIASSSYFKNIYDNSVWNIALRKKPDVDVLSGSSGPYTYTIEMYAVNTNSSNQQEFSCSIPYNQTSGYLRYYIGARKNGLEGSTIYNSNSKFLYCNFWTDYLKNLMIIKVLELDLTLPLHLLF